MLGIQPWHLSSSNFAGFKTTGQNATGNGAMGFIWPWVSKSLESDSDYPELDKNGLM